MASGTPNGIRQGEGPTHLASRGHLLPSTEDDRAATDASKTRGLGYALIQRDESGRKHLIQCGSQSLTTCRRELGHPWIGGESNWVRNDQGQTSLDGSSRIHGGHRQQTADFHVHKTNGWSDQCRVLRIRERLVNFSFKVTWQAGKSPWDSGCTFKSPCFQTRRRPRGRCRSECSSNSEQGSGPCHAAGGSRCRRDIPSNPGCPEMRRHEDVAT